MRVRTSESKIEYKNKHIQPERKCRRSYKKWVFQA